jgi:hypothetical protein|tara:strand:+ start:830 stop:2230 length:1401 start_codon:yes stop_codon:yes gene_type:complete
MKYLIPLLFPITLLAEEITTSNLITNGGFDNGTTGWTLSGDAVHINDCCPGGHDLEFGINGSIEQSFNLINNSITQTMLDQNGVVLNSSVEVQNGECSVAGCWGGSGPADSFTVRLQIRDDENNVLATTTQERFDVTGINGEDFTNSLTYTGIGSYSGNIFISGSDSNNRAGGGPNVDNIVTTLTYNDEVQLLSETETQSINTAFEEIEEVVEEISFEPIEIETFSFEPIEQAELEISIPEETLFTEIQTEEINTGIVNVFSQEITEVSYGNQEELEEVSAEVEVYEERIEAEESSGPTTETENTIVEETNTENSIEVAERQSETERENGGTSSGSEDENLVGGDERESGEDETTGGETTTVATGDEPVQSDQEVSVESISVSDIAKRVERVVADIDKQLVITSNIVARQMQNNKIQSYNNINQKIFEQPILNDTDISYYTNTTYVDIREIYSGQTYEDKLWTSRQ